eukprot:gene25813-31174_t
MVNKGRNKRRRCDDSDSQSKVFTLELFDHRPVISQLVSSRREENLCDKISFETIIEILQLQMAEDMTLRFKTDIQGSTMTFGRRKRVAEIKMVSGEEVESSSKKSKVAMDVEFLHLPAPLLSMFHDQVFNHKLRQQEKYVLKHPVFGYLNHEITQKGHVRLYAFLCEVMVEQRLNYSTMLYAMQLFDQVLARYENFQKEQILVLGSACLTLACKLEEIYPIEIEALMNSANYAYNKDELLTMEHTILSLMRYQIVFPTRLDFANYYATLLSLSPRQHHLLDFLVGISLVDFNLNYLPASQVVAAAIHVCLQLTMPARHTTVWTEKHRIVTGYSEEALLEGILRIRALHNFIRDYPLPHLVNIFRGESRAQVADIYGIPHSQMRLHPCHEYIVKEKEEFVYVTNPSHMMYAFRFIPVLDVVSSACDGNGGLKVIKGSTAVTRKK